MGRTSREQDLIIDLLDDLMTFAFVYEGELRPGTHVPDLEALGRSVAAHLEKRATFPLFKTPEERRIAVFIVLNRLQQEASSPALPERKDVERAWVHSAPNLTTDSLRADHARCGAALLQLVEATVGRLAADPAEARGFMTREQVRGTLLATLPAVPACAACPIHLQSLVVLVHQNFLEAFGGPSGRVARNWRDVVNQYMDLALRALEERAKQVVIDGLVLKHLPAARKLKIGIGRFYSWATVWDRPVAGEDLLVAYASLNASGALRDKKFRNKPEHGAEPSLGFEFIRSWAARRPCLLPQFGGSAARIFFNTDDVDIRIEGRAIQKHALMAMRYDEPLGELNEVVGRFRTYLLSQRRKYCAASRQPLQVEEHAAIQRRTQEAMVGRKTNRSLLHDKSSVLSHLCVLLWVQRQRNLQYEGKSAKAHHRSILEMVQDAGFEFSYESVRKACAINRELPARLREDLARLARS
jgi:hypothetical protein